MVIGVIAVDFSLRSLIVVVGSLVVSVETVDAGGIFVTLDFVVSAFEVSAVVAVGSPVNGLATDVVLKVVLESSAVLSVLCVLRCVGSIVEVYNLFVVWAVVVISGFGVVIGTK